MSHCVGGGESYLIQSVLFRMIRHDSLSWCYHDSLSRWLRVVKRDTPSEAVVSPKNCGHVRDMVDF